MDFPNVIGPYGPIRNKIMFETTVSHLNTLESNVSTFETYLTTGPRIFQPAALAIGTSSAADVLMLQPLIVLNEGALITIAAIEIDVSALAETPVEVTTTQKYRCLLTAALADGTINFVEGTAVASTADATTPSAPTGTIGFGYVEITTAASTTFGTTALTGISTFHDLITPLP